MLTAILSPFKDMRAGRQHSIGVLVFQKKALADTVRHTRQSSSAVIGTESCRDESRKKISQHSRKSDVIGVLPAVGLHKWYFLKDGKGCIQSYVPPSELESAEPIPPSLLEELRDRDLLGYPEGGFYIRMLVFYTVFLLNSMIP